MDARFHIELFGDMRVIQGEQAHTRFRTRKAALLLAYLALNMPQAQPRERLVELFWGDKEEAVGRDGLSTALAQLRRQLEPSGVPADSLLVADKQQVRLNPASVSVDVADFDRLIKASRQTEDKPQKADLLQAAIEMYRGELLPGCYEDWATGEQTRCRTLYLESLLQLIPLWEEAGRYADALGMAQRACGADPFAEESYRAQMRLLVRLRTPSAALQVYEKMEQMFQQELGARPSASTRQMVEMIRQDPRAALMLRAEAASARATVAPASPKTAVVSAPPTVSPASTLLDSAAPPLPLQLTRFFGRTTEREEIAALLQTPGTRLVTLLGPGGAGKTRLSLEVASQVAPAFANRVWFVSLADIPDASLIAPTLARSLRLPPDTQSDPLDRVSAFLGDAPCLLVLDNMEHLLREAPGAGKNDNAALSGSAGLIHLLMQRVPGLVCLATSRTALRLRGEQVFPLPPLALPSQADATKPETLANNPSVSLYVDRARAARPDFALTSHNAPAVIALCRRLEGMPLAIEMAAAWVKTIPPAKMLERLSRQLDLLVSRHRDLPPRHQSLRATIEWSYDLLTPDLQTFFARLGVFRGGWTLEAAEAVCGKDALYALAELQEHSLIVAHEPTGDEEGACYRMLEPLREFAREKLAEIGEDTIVHSAHAAFFLELAREASRHYHSADPRPWLDRLDADLENLRAAGAWTQEHDCEQSLWLSAWLTTFWHLRGHAAEGCRLTLQTLARPEAAAPTPTRATALEGIGYLLLFRGDFAQAQACAEEAAQIWRALGNKQHSLTILNLLAILACDTGNPGRACELWQEMLPLTQEMGLKEAEAATLHNLGETLLDRGQPEQARPLLDEALLLARTLHDTERISRTLNILGKTLLRLGDPAARHYLQESLQMRHEINDHPGVVETLETCMGWMALQGAAESAAIVGGATQSLRAQGAAHRPPNEEAQFADSLARVRVHLTPSEFQTAWERGETLTRDQAVHLALAVLAH